MTAFQSTAFQVNAFQTEANVTVNLTGVQASSSFGIVIGSDAVIDAQGQELMAQLGVVYVDAWNKEAPISVGWSTLVPDGTGPWSKVNPPSNGWTKIPT